MEMLESDDAFAGDVLHPEGPHICRHLPHRHREPTPGQGRPRAHQFTEFLHIFFQSGSKFLAQYGTEACLSNQPGLGHYVLARIASEVSDKLEMFRI
jgi:hypothetical protein